MSVFVIAFDGVLFPTLGLRADAVLHAAKSEGVVVSRDDVLAALPGRTLAESCETVLGTLDITLTDLVALRAQQQAAQRMAQGLAVSIELVRWIGAQRSAGHRFVLRADSSRVHVDPLLQLSELDHVFTVVRCADDPPRDSQRSSIVRSYDAIVRRLDGMFLSGEREFVEYGGEASRVAAVHGLVACELTARFQECRLMHRELPPNEF